MLRDDNATLLDLVAAARLAIQFKGVLGHAEFLNDLKTQSAVLHQLLIIGEAAKRLSGAFRSAHPEVPWKTMAGMRDKLIHEYDDADMDEVWNTVTTDIPHLLKLLGPLVPPEH